MATWAGGANLGTGCLNGGGCGAVFKIGRYGAFTTLYTFCSQGNCRDGAYPNGLAEGAYGSFYGVAGGMGTAKQQSGHCLQVHTRRTGGNALHVLCSR